MLDEHFYLAAERWRRITGRRHSADSRFFDDTPDAAPAFTQRDGLYSGGYPGGTVCTEPDPRMAVRRHGIRHRSRALLYRVFRRTVFPYRGSEAFRRKGAGCHTGRGAVRRRGRHADDDLRIPPVRAVCTAAGRHRLRHGPCLHHHDDPAVPRQRTFRQPAFAGDRFGRRGGPDRLQRLYRRGERAADRPYTVCRRGAAPAVESGGGGAGAGAGRAAALACRAGAFPGTHTGTRQRGAFVFERAVLDTGHFTVAGLYGTGRGLCEPGRRKASVQADGQILSAVPAAVLRAFRPASQHPVPRNGGRYRRGLFLRTHRRQIRGGQQRCGAVPRRPVHHQISGPRSHASGRRFHRSCRAGPAHATCGRRHDAGYHHPFLRCTV